MHSAISIILYIVPLGGRDKSFDTSCLSSRDNLHVAYSYRNNWDNSSWLMSGAYYRDDWARRP